jgi:uncharacterized protein YciI
LRARDAQTAFLRQADPAASDVPLRHEPVRGGFDGRHAEYLRGQFEAGRLVAYGPVLSQNPFGLIIVEAEEEREVHELMAGDPKIGAGLNGYDIAPMHVTGARAT